MKKLNIVISFFLFLVLSEGCVDKNNTYEVADPKRFAGELCSCLKRNHAEKDYLYALTVCDGELVQKNHFYRLYRIDLKYLSTEKKISQQVSDSVFKFMRIVDSCTRTDCCEARAICDSKGTK